MTDELTFPITFPLDWVVYPEVIVEPGTEEILGNDLFTINSIDVLPYLIKYSNKQQTDANDVTSGTARFSLSIYDVLTPTVGQDVIISRGVVVATEDYIMRGRIIKFDVEDTELLIYFEGRFSKYKRLMLTYSFDKNIDPEAGIFSEIWKTIITDGGLTASAVSSGTDVTVNKFICNDSYRYERASTLTKILGWQQYDDYNNNYVRLEPKGYTTYSTKLVVGTNILKIPVWEEDLESVRNFIKIKGVYEEDTEIQNFVGTGSQYVYDLTYEPEITEVTVGGVLKTRGAIGSTTAYDYVVDKTNKTLTFTVAPVLSAAVVIKYSYRRPKPVQGKDYDSIALYGEERSEVYSFDDVTTVADAEVRVRQLLKLLATATVKTKLMTYPTNGLHVGMLVDVEDSINPQYNGTYIVNEVENLYPEPYDIIQIGSTDFKLKNLLETISARLKSLEAEDELNAEILTSLIQIVASLQLDVRLIKKTAGVIDTGVLYFDHPSQGTWDDFDWGDDTDEVDPTNVTMLMPGNNIFSEYVYDTMFYDAVNSVDVDFNTTTNIITLDATTGILYTNAISIGKDYSNYNVFLENVSATGLTVEISADDKSTWETVTLATQTDFIAITSNVYLRISNTTAGAITISNILNAGNKKTFPAIYVELE